jgi:hypothetical protein
MPLRADRLSRLRLLGEWTLRALAIVTLAWAAVASLRPESSVPLEHVGITQLPTALPRLTFQAPAAGIHVSLDSAPSRLDRDWLVALRRAGTPVTWDGRLRPLAISAEPMGDPRGEIVVRVAAPRGAAVGVADRAGSFDTVAVASEGMAMRVPEVIGMAAATMEQQQARAIVHDSLVLRPILVVGEAGWEGKYLVAALEEEGWTVSTRFSLGRGTEVRQGAQAPIDTAHYSVAIVLDTTAHSLAGALTGFARSGGGVVILGSAASIPGLRDLLPGTVGPPTSLATQISDTVSPATLAATPLRGLAPDAVVLERRIGSGPVVAVHRVNAGRVALVGYRDSWRWRLGGDDDAVRAHRDWWNAIVSAVAYAPPARSTARDEEGGGRPREVTEPAPLANLVDALGPSRVLRNDATTLLAPAGGQPPWWLATIVFAALLAEWASRRIRGAR